MIKETNAAPAAVLASAGAAWPNVLCFLTESLASPYERAIATAWCGGGPQPYELLGHCPACWAGGAVLLAAAAILMHGPRRRPLRVKHSRASGAGMF